ncbi:hypothetical protein FQZ97_884410 [compost metagenome]
MSLLSTDIWSIEQKLWAVRNGRCRTDISFDTGLAIGYMTALRSHGIMSECEYIRLDLLLHNAQYYAMLVVYDLEVQGWSEV